MNRLEDLHSQDGCPLAFYSWHPEQQAKANVLIIHGFAEHSGRYDHFANFLAGCGYRVYGLDLRGHGRSGGEEAYLKDSSDYVADLNAALQFIRSTHPDEKLFLLGHSMGGLVVVTSLLDLKPDIAGVVLTAPGLKVDPDLSPLLRRLTPLIALVAPKLKAIKLDPKLVSRDPEVVKKYIADPLIYHDGIKAGYAAAILRAIKSTSARFSEFTYPVLILHGEKDKLTDPAGSAQLAQEASSTDLTHQVLPGLFHEILNEPEKEEVYEIVRGWLDQRA